MEVSEWTPKQLEAYENAKQRELDEQWEMEKEKEKSKAEGIAQGIAEGIEEGKLKVIKESLKGLVIAIKQKLEHNLIKSIFSLFEEEQITTIEKHISKGHVLDNGQYQDCDCNADGLAKLIGLEPSLQLDVHSSNLE
jgi:flagellar biosynthesis/type III secretory pathway protein FliH